MCELLSSMGQDRYGEFWQDMTMYNVSSVPCAQGTEKSIYVQRQVSYFPIAAHVQTVGKYSVTKKH